MRQISIGDKFYPQVIPDYERRAVKARLRLRWLVIKKLLGSIDEKNKYKNAKE